MITTRAAAKTSPSAKRSPSVAPLNNDEKLKEPKGAQLVSTAVVAVTLARNTGQVYEPIPGFEVNDLKNVDDLPPPIHFTKLSQRIVMSPEPSARPLSPQLPIPSVPRFTFTVSAVGWDNSRKDPAGSEKGRFGSTAPSVFLPTRN